MDFRKIELIGFKSFADKQEIRFDNGVTCIVGPNGCGKSNVADAVKWVLGEQSAKTLRGTNMQDVIFSGTQNRKSLSYCEVSLTFDNSNKIFKDIDYDEVVFTRKLFRSGESEYYVNKKPSRLRDIIDLLHECGISKEGYTVIGQGKVSEILSSKPEDRRAIFEEAVGIAKTKAKRLETSRKLDRTRDNIVRIADITTELERQLEPLSKQAEKARAYRALSDELKYHEVNAYLYRRDNAASVKSRINLKIDELKEQLEARNLELNEAVKAYNAHQREISEADDYIRQLNAEHVEKVQAYERQSGEAKVYDEKINFFRAEIKRLEGEISEAEGKISELGSKIREKNEYAETCGKEIEKIENRSADIRAELLKVLSEMNEGEKMAEDAQNAILTSVENLADIKQAIGALDAEKNVMTERQRETLEKVKTLSDELSLLYAEKAAAENETSALEKTVQTIKDDVKDKQADIESINYYINDVTNKLYALNSDISALEANRRMYGNLRDSFDGFQYAVKKLLTAAKSDDEIGKRVKGVVANVIRTDKKYDVAIETCLGGAVQNVVTATPDDARYLIQYLKRTEGGRVTFLPVSSMKPRYETSETRRALSERGALGLANELVSYDKYYDNVVRYLLGNTLIAEDIDSAVKIAEKYRFAFKIVTLDGDVIASNGSLSGGSRKQNTSNLLAMDRKLEETKAELDKKRAEMERLSSRREQLKAQVEEGTDELHASEIELQETRNKIAALKEKTSAIDQRIAATEKEVESYKDDVALLSTRLSEINKQYTDIEQGGDELLKARKTAAESAEKRKSVSDEYKKRRDTLMEENSELSARKSFLTAEINAAKEDVSRMIAEREGLYNDIAEARKNVESDNAVIKGYLSEIEHVALTETEQEYINVLRGKIASFEGKKKELGEAVVQDNLKREMAQAEINKLNEKKYSEEVALSKVDTDLEYMEQRVSEEYGLTYETAKDLRDENYDVSSSTSETSRIKKKINALGDVNHNAISDYDDLKSRYDELAEQRADLEKAESDLKTVIDQLTNEMSSTFSEGFAKIRANFTRIFKELFGGGTADLVLETDETEDPLEQGIEIVAEPPGKKLQKISLLSGGEMALTAIAILFAILRLRPMPFVVLDEIEAALDDANVERFANYLRNFSKDTQFIVITHKKVTMEKADALFGVTMQEKGVSKIISVKLTDVDRVEAGGV